MWWGSEENAWRQGGLTETQGQVADSHIENATHGMDHRKKDIKCLFWSAASAASHLKPFPSVAHELQTLLSQHT